MWIHYAYIMIYICFIGTCVQKLKAAHDNSEGLSIRAICQLDISVDDFIRSTGLIQTLELL